MKQTIIRGASVLTILLLAFAGCKKEEQKKGAIKGLEKVSLDLQINKDQAEKAALGMETGKKGKAFGQGTIRNTDSLNTIAFLAGVNFALAAIAVKAGHVDGFKDSLEGIQAFAERLGGNIGDYGWTADVVAVANGMKSGSMSLEKAGNAFFLIASKIVAVAASNSNGVDFANHMSMGMYVFSTATCLKVGTAVDINSFTVSLTDYLKLYGSQINTETKEDIEKVIKELKPSMGEEDNSKYADLLIKIADRINIM